MFLTFISGMYKVLMVLIVLIHISKFSEGLNTLWSPQRRIILNFYEDIMGTSVEGVQPCPCLSSNSCQNRDLILPHSLPSILLTKSSLVCISMT